MLLWQVTCVLCQLIIRAFRGLEALKRQYDVRPSVCLSNEASWKPPNGNQSTWTFRPMPRPRMSIVSSSQIQDGGRPLIENHCRHISVINNPFMMKVDLVGYTESHSDYDKTKSQAIARIADRTASQHLWFGVTWRHRSLTWPSDSP